MSTHPIWNKSYSDTENLKTKANISELGFFFATFDLKGGYHYTAIHKNDIGYPASANWLGNSTGAPDILCSWSHIFTHRPVGTLTFRDQLAGLGRICHHYQCFTFAVSHRKLQKLLLLTKKEKDPFDIGHLFTSLLTFDFYLRAPWGSIRISQRIAKQTSLKELCLSVCLSVV